jgi:replication factor C subunit 1
MYTLKYRPNKIEDFIGNKNIIQPFIYWLLEWNPNNNKTKCALFSGLNGIGKSLLIDLILKKHDYNIVNLSIDDNRDKETITQIIMPLIKTKKTFDGQNNCLVVSDINNSGGDYGFISTLTECIKETQIPIICICDDRYDTNIKPILNYSVDFKLVKSNYNDIYRLIYKVITNENIKISKQEVEKLYEQSNGDIRFILNSLQLGLKNSDTSKNIQSLNIFDTTGKLFSMETTMDDKFKYYWMSHDIHTLMVQENYINNILTTKDNVKRLENISYSADSLSDADIFDSIFDFELSSYVAMNTIKATTKCNNKTNVIFPQFLGRNSTINKNKRDKFNYENVNLLGEIQIKTKTKAEPKIKIKAEPKIKKETKPKIKKETKPKIQKETKNKK